MSIRGNSNSTPSAGDSPHTPRWARLRGKFAGAEGHDVVSPAPIVPVREIFRFFWPYARPYRFYLLAILGLIVAVPLLQGARLYMIKVTVDEVLIPRDLTALGWIIPLTIGLTAFSGVFAYFHSYLSTWVGESFLLSLRSKFFEHMQGLSLDFFEHRRLGDVLSRLTADVNAIESLFLSGIADSLSAAVRVVLFAGALFFLDWQLALVAFTIAPVFALVVRVLSRLLKRASREKRRRTGALTAIAEESLSNVALVQSYNRQELEIDRFNRQNKGAFEATMIGTRIKSMLPPIIDVVQVASGLAVLAVGTVALKDGRLSVGELLVFIAYVNQLYSPMRMLANLYNVVYAASAGAERVLETFREKPSITDLPDAPDLPRAQGHIEFDGLSLLYPETTRPAVANVDLRVEPGQAVALVGHSGAGKSTLAKLLLRFYDPTDGAVLIDGTDLRAVQLASVRESIAVLLQETLIFEGTIRENILYGRPGATDEKVESAARAADAHEFVTALPEGYETLVGQKGRRLSGGERQRVAIARAMIRDAPILILDEPTTGLDAESSRRILDPIRRLMRDRTTVVISHNLLTVRDADLIVVLEHGRIIEQGSHDELVEHDGAYAKLCRLQEAASYARLAEDATDPG